MPMPTLYLKGTFNGWGLDTPFVPISDSQLQVSVVFSADRHQYKIADMDGSAQWTLAAHPTQAVALNLDQPQTLISTQGIGNDLAFTPSQTGRFTLTLDLSGPAPTLTITSGASNQQALAQRALLDTELKIDCDPLPALNTRHGALAANDLFDTLAIEETGSFAFVFGDNVDGYYEGRSHCFVGAGRYRHHQGWYLGGFAAFVDGKLLDKTQASSARLLPYGIVHQFANHSQDRLSLAAGQRLVTLSVESQTEAVLSLLPELNLGLNDCTIEAVDDMVLIAVKPELCPEGAPRFIAISANQAISVKEVSFDEYPALDTAVHLNGQNCKLMLTTVRACAHLSVYLCFEHNSAEALHKAKLAAKQHAEKQHQQQIYQFLTDNYLWCDDVQYNRAVMWARLASRTFVSHEFGAGIWAGLPWFKDCWGRDTFIALSGTSLVNGAFDEAREIISNFAAMQKVDLDDVNHGRIPNRVTSKTNIIYNTTDGTPWMIREVMEYIHYSGDMTFAEQIYPVVQRFIQGVEKHYLGDDGLMSHRDPDTWMDAKINGQIPWSPRGPKANDIQALWFESLQIAEQLAHWLQDLAFAAHCEKLSQQVAQSFVAKFWNPQSQRLADCLLAQDIADESTRPNQLLTLTIPLKRNLLSANIAQHVVKNSVEQLLFPWGICSLAQDHLDFHPYHDNRSEYHKDAAYHNGTIWGWNAGFTVSALCQFKQQDFAYQLSKNLAQQILTQGHRGTMSENLDAYQSDENALVMTGTYAQAWSVSEYARNTQQDYLGFTPRLAEQRIILRPALPSAWQQVKARLPFGQGNALWFEMTSNEDGIIYSVKAERHEPSITLLLELETSDKHLQITAALQSKLQVTISDGKVTLSPSDVHCVESAAVHYPLLDGLSFAQPDWQREHPALTQSDYLLQKRMAEKLNIAQD